MIVTLALAHLRRHRTTALLAAGALALGVALVLAVTLLRQQVAQRLMHAQHGIDALAVPPGSPLQAALALVHHLDHLDGRVDLAALDDLRRHPAVAEVYPVAVGHSFAGVPLLGIDPRFWTTFAWAPGRTFQIAAGRWPQHPREVLAGAEAAEHLGLSPGGRLVATCGAHDGAPVHDQDALTVVGVLAPTGTPHDRVLTLALADVAALGGHRQEALTIASGAYVVLRRIRGNAWHPAVQDLRAGLPGHPDLQVVLPEEVLPRLFTAIAWADRVLGGVALLVALLGTAFAGLTLVAALREGRRDLALLRCLGAGRRVVAGLMLLQALVIAGVGTLLGLVLAHGLLLVATPLVARTTGLHLEALVLSPAHLLALAAAPLLALLAASVPAILAYRLPVLDVLEDR